MAMQGGFNSVPNVDGLIEGVHYREIQWDFAAQAPAPVISHVPGTPCPDGFKMVFGLCRPVKEGVETQEERDVRQKAEEIGSSATSNKRIDINSKKYGWAIKNGKPIIVEWGSVAGLKNPDGSIKKVKPSPVNPNRPSKLPAPTQSTKPSTVVPKPSVSKTTPPKPTEVKPQTPKVPPSGSSTPRPSAPSASAPGKPAEKPKVKMADIRGSQGNNRLDAPVAGRGPKGNEVGSAPRTPAPQPSSSKPLKPSPSETRQTAEKIKALRRLNVAKDNYRRSLDLERPSDPASAARFDKAIAARRDRLKKAADDYKRIRG